MWKVDDILQVFAPFDCLGCQVEGRLVCRDCLERLPASPECCYKCLKPSTVAVCQYCLRQTCLSAVWTTSAYQGVSVQLISRLKFSRTQAAAYLIAQVLDRRIPNLRSDTVVVHVPTASQRIRQRGYDQARLIAREFARLRELPYQALLSRQGKTRQVGANRAERLRQLEKAYHCIRPELVVGKRILLIDDVLTTGATLETAAQVLKSAGASEIRGITFAQKV